MPALPSFEIEKRLKKLEVKPVASTALVKKVGDQYEYDKDFIYVAYASALANLSGGAIPSQSDATDFQLTPYNTSGVLLAYRGYLLNKSVYQSGDPTDYIWESTSGEAGFTSSERYHTTSTGLQETLGNPTKPGTNITWTVINAGTAVPSTAVYVAERFTITTTDGAVTSEWKIKIVGKHIDDTVIKTGGVTTDTIASNAITSAKVTADAITVEKIDLNGALNVTANNGSILWGKTGSTDISNTGLFLGRDGSGNPRIVFGNASSFINFDGTDVSLVNCDVDNNAGTNVVSLINYIVVASEYIDSNIDAANGIANNSQQSSSNVAIKWFKIVPEIIDFIGWDNKQKRYKFSIQWTISVHGMFYSDFPWAPKSKPKGTGVHKIYDYIFSGNNTEITDLTLQFDNAYYNAHTIGTGVTKGDKEDKFNLTAKSKAIPPNKQGISNDETITKQRSKDLMTSLMYDGYDLIQLDLAILGDPAFLPIGDAFFQTQGNRNAVYDNAFLPDDTINYDLTPPYVQLNLKTPTDYNDLTGLVDLSGNGKYASSQFSGVYRVTETDSSFSGGMFTQRLSGFREKAQPINGKVGGYGRSTKIRKDSPSALDDSIATGINPAPSLLSQGSAVLSTVGESRITGFQARRIQRLADEADQGRFEEGIGDEEPPVELTDNNNIVSVDQFTELLKDYH